jgi:hypothetical protein
LGNEHLADVFAVWAVGPAYPFVCVYLRFDPSEADRDWPFHPSMLKRIHVILRVLKTLDDDDGSDHRRIRDVAEELGREWTAVLVGAKAGTSRLPHDLGNQLDVLTDVLTELLTTRLGRLPRYDGWERAKQLQSNWGMDASVLAPDLQLWDVVNAAWLCRLEMPTQDLNALQNLGSGALDLCLGLMRNRHSHRAAAPGRALRPT